MSVVFPTSELKPLIATIAGRFIILFNYSKTPRLETDDSHSQDEQAQHYSPSTTCVKNGLPKCPWRFYAFQKPLDKLL
jgi:hypothetical protein